VRYLIDQHGESALRVFLGAVDAQTKPQADGPGGPAPHRPPRPRGQTRNTRPGTSSVGIGYLKLFDATHHAELADRVNYTAMPSPTTPTSTSGEDTTR
jgi:hypothetical protein